MAARFAYKSRTAADIYRRLLDIAVQDDTYETVLDALGSGIKASAKRIDRAGDEDAIADIETEIIENLLGVAYVVCQVKITAVTSAALRFPAIFRDPASVRRVGPYFDNKYSKIEVLWALGNYYKHRDEWKHSTWTAPRGFAKHTVPVIKAVGLRDNSTGNLRAGAKALGNSAFADVAAFRKIVDAWSKQVYASVP